MNWKHICFQIILEELGKNCVEIARDIIGCSIFQRCLDQAKGVVLKGLIEEIVSNVLLLVEDRYGYACMWSCFQVLYIVYIYDTFLFGLQSINWISVFFVASYRNYVVLHIIKMKIPVVNAAIVSQLIGKLSQLSMSKHGSNVVEGLLEFSEEREAAIIVKELVSSSNFVAILRSPYGNHVAQRALKNSKV